IVNWLSGDDSLFAIQPRPAADSSLELDHVALLLIAFTFLFVLPFAFMVTGAVIWWRRRKV
ncbi:MAG: ABC transporter, partial [Betaproteobacteria bacterium]|nr:ABC transporter [Betaproteobacteria bacterium]